MNPITVVGAGLGFGLFLIVRSIVFVPASLTSRQCAEWNGSVSAWRTKIEALRQGSRAELLICSRPRLGANVERNLAIMERTPAGFAIEKLSTALALGR